MSLTEVLTFAVEKVAKLGMDALKQSANAEQEMMSLATFVGAQNAPSIYHQLQDANTPFSTRTLAGVDKSLMSAGVSSDQALNDTINLANTITAVGGNDKTLSDIALNMQRIKMEGRASREELQEFAKEGINVYQLLADATGKPISKIGNMTVSYELLAKALDKAGQKGGMYYGAMQAQSQSISGKWSTFINYMQFGEQSLTLSQSNNIKAFEDILISAAKRIPEIVSSIAPYISKLIDGVKKVLPDLKKFSIAIINLVKPFFNLSLSDNMKQFRDSVIKLATDIARILTPAMEAFATGLTKLMGVFSFIADKVEGVYNKVANYVQSKDDDITRRKYMSDWGFNYNELTDGAMAYIATSRHIPFHNRQEFFEWKVKQKTEQLQNEYGKLYGVLPGYLLPNITNNTPSPYVHPMAGVASEAANNPDAPAIGMGGGSDGASGKADKISSGGVRTVTINLGKFFDNFTINTQTINEGIDHLDNAVAESLLRVMNSAAKARE